MAAYRLFVPLLALLLLGPGCGGKGNPIQQSGTLTINTPSDVIKCGACQPFTATHTKGGVSQTVTPTWSTDNPAVATISATGELTAVSHGNVTVTARYENATASKGVRIVIDYGAAWYGNYLVTRCVATGAFDSGGWCAQDALGAGQTLPLALDLQQDRDNVTGTLYLGSLEGSFTGSVASGGEVTGESKFTYTDDNGVVVDVLVSPFSALRQGDRIAEGTFTVVVTATGFPGNCTFDGRILGLDKAPSGRTSARHVGGVRSLHDLLRLLRQR